MDYGTVRWIVNSEYTGQPVYWTKHHYVANDGDKTLCGVRIPKTREGIVEPDFGCGAGDPFCERCEAIAEKSEKQDAINERRNRVDVLVAEFRELGNVNPAEIMELDSTLTIQAVIASVKRLGGRKIGNTNWYTFRR